MKQIQQYCSAMDKIKHDPACKQEVLNMAQRNQIHMTKRSGKVAGTAIAAALLAANIGGGYLLLHGRNQALNPPVATEIESEIDLASAAETAALPCYVSRMQEYYAELTGEPCDFDFTGLGRDFENVSAEDENWRVELKAVTGCDWILYYFYDVTPLQGQSWEQFQQEHPRMEAEVFGGGRTDHLERCGIMPGAEHTPEDGAWHCYGRVFNSSAQPFFHADKTFCLRAQISTAELDTEVTREPLDFVSAEFPLEESDGFNNIFEAIYIGQGANMLGMDPAMTRYAVTPFGMNFFSDPYESGKRDSNTYTDFGEQSFMDITFTSADDGSETRMAVYDGIIGYSEDEGTGIQYSFAAFERPLDVTKFAPENDVLTAEAATTAADVQTTETQTTTEAAVQDYEAIPRKVPADVPCVVYSAQNIDTGEPFDSLADPYPDTTPEERAQFEQVAVYSRYAKLLVNGRELKGIGEEISPDENNMLNITFAWTPDENVKNQNISIDILPDPAFDDPIAYGKSEGENIVIIEPYKFKDYVDPETNAVYPSSLPEAIAAFTPDPTAENCVPMRYSMQIDLSKVDLQESPHGKQLTFLVDYHAADTSGSKKDVIFRGEYILMIK